MCAFVCTPKKGDEVLINAQVLADQELVRLAVDVEGREFQFKLGYWKEQRLHWKDWWLSKEQDLLGWMKDQGVEDAFPLVCVCCVRMRVPMLARIGETNESVPAEEETEAPPDEWKEVLPDTPPNPTRVGKKPKPKKSEPPQDDSGPELF